MEINTISSIEEIKLFCKKNFFDISPFISYEFFRELETSKCTSPSNGWSPEHLVITNNKVLEGIIPNFKKSNSNGEYVFDHIFANAYNQIGKKYYPKYLSAIPFTPVKRNKFFYANNSKFSLKNISKYLIPFFSKKEISSFHINFIGKTMSDELSQHNFSQRLGMQYYWYNRSYQTFDCFLSSLKRTKRKNIIKERSFLKDEKIKCIVKRSNEITSKDIELFYKCYSNTIKKKWSIHYLNQLFFEKLVESNLKNQMVIIQAFKEDIFLGCSLHFIGDNTLYGRYWGALQEVPFLHFELCYYQAIEFAIQNKLSKVEAGAQGEHKISRGYIPELTYSNHWFESHELKESINIFFYEEGKKVKDTIEYLKKLSPFKS